MNTRRERISETDVDALQRHIAQLEGELARARERERALGQQLETYRPLVEQSLQGLAIFQANRLVFVNEMMANLMGYAVADMATWTFADVARCIHPDDRALVMQRLRERLEGIPLPNNYVTRTIRRDGAILWLALFAISTSYQGSPAVLATFLDVTERKQQEEALHAINAEREYWLREVQQHNWNMTLLNGMNEFLQRCVTVEAVYRVTALQVRQIFVDYTGALYIYNMHRTAAECVVTWGTEQPDEAVVIPERCWALRRERPHIVSDTTSVPACQHMQQTASPPYPYICVPLQTQKQVFGLLHLRHTMTTTPQHHEHQGWLATMVAVNIALTLSNIHLREQLHYQSIHDALTGLFNRRYMAETLKREISHAARYQQTIGVLMLDIDFFKRFNDTYGHEAGDVVLQAVGHFLQTHVRQEDVSCRYGGEEFVIIMPGAALEDTYRRAEQLCADIRLLNVHHKGEPLGAITISMGVASYPTHGLTAEALLNGVDQALYRAKSEGRNCIVLAQSLGQQTAAPS
jgi:diguanylate cyclase (GGDEF)-like protein/PAS domain S-box-containing protein